MTDEVEKTGEEQLGAAEPEQPEAGTEKKNPMASILAAAVKVITRPVDFYREMPKSGGMIDPLIFLVALAVATGVMHAVLGLVRGSLGGALVAGLASIILVPIVVVVVGFVVAAVLFGIWKLMGSDESFETAFRCMAYTMAIAPITSLLGLIPYLGGIVGLAWSSYLLVVASTEVHKVRQQTAYIVFGVIFLVLALFRLNSELAGRRFAKHAKEWERQVGDVEDMSPEEAGRALGEFLKGIQEVAEEGE
ncbi:YIP1 family protein [Verrucomicrobiota bacterium]